MHCTTANTIGTAPQSSSLRGGYSLGQRELAVAAAAALAVAVLDLAVAPQHLVLHLAVGVQVWVAVARVARVLQLAAAVVQAVVLAVVQLPVRRSCPSVMV